MRIIRTVVFVAATAGMAVGCGGPNKSAKAPAPAPASTAPKATNPCAPEKTTTPDEGAKPGGDKANPCSAVENPCEGAPKGDGKAPADGGNPDG